MDATYRNLLAQLCPKEPVQPVIGNVLLIYLEKNTKILNM